MIALLTNLGGEQIERDREKERERDRRGRKERRVQAEVTSCCGPVIQVYKTEK